jgi:Na+-translocating ferredoxin:NAD+ oxidoreductase RNF subunit RnfB
MITALSGVFFILILGVGLGALLTVAARAFAVHLDPVQESLEKALPGLNCASCGYTGCSTYAEVLFKKTEEDIEKCKPGGPELVPILANLLGREYSGSGIRKVAWLHCAGGQDKTLKKLNYAGLEDCNAARLLFDGQKGCKYSCLGFGSCIGVCPVNAISKTGDGLVRVDRNLCIGCEKCIAICPTKVLKMIPFNAAWYVACNSKDPGKVTKTNCSIGCIGCAICEKKFPGSGFKMNENLSVLDYSINGKDQDQAAAKCPVKCILEVK